MRAIQEGSARQLPTSWFGRWQGVLLAAGLTLTAGCQSFGLNLLSCHRGDDKAAEREAPTPALPGAPGKYSFRVAPYVFLSDFEIQPDLPLFKDLARLRDQVYKELSLPPGTAAVQVYLFEDRERYERFMQARYPYLPSRRAFFVSQPRTIGGTEDLLVYTFWGDRIQQDLRHELTHALLHSVLKEVPLWLDEGLAEYFELPPENQGVNPAHVDHLCHDAGGLFQPELARLEGLSQVQQMKHPEYREAWAWVHFLLHHDPETRALLLRYLQQLRSNPNLGPLGPHLAEVVSAPDAALKEHVSRLDANSDPKRN
jgi:hypothetical protein